MKWFRVRFGIEDELTIMDVAGYSHIQFESEKQVYGAGRYYLTKTAFIRSRSYTRLVKALKEVFGYSFGKFVWERIDDA